MSKAGVEVSVVFTVLLILGSPGLVTLTHFMFQHLFFFVIENKTQNYETSKS